MRHDMKEALNLEIRKNCKRLYLRLFIVFIVAVALVSQIGIEKYKHEVEAPFGTGKVLHHSIIPGW